ncbi:hypothetical protein GCM10009122_25520 [Fulvivirga kasyanovii]|uniref:DUF4435 domain-containing protein n=1 Tax=Fulvivirga kasyanovii TaxID=396812 RepID=UPI0031E15B9B
MLEFKKSILPNLGVFFRYKNTVDVFVEDNYDDEFYKVIVNRVFEKTGHKINKLISLGGKRNVIDACKADQQKREIKRVYIVDGDLDLINDTNENGINYLFVLNKYCIENYLIQEGPLIEIIHDNILIEKEKISKILSFENWIKGISDDLVELFIHYALCKRYVPTQPTISLGIGNLCYQKSKITVLDSTQCHNRIKALKSKLLEVISEEDYNEMVYDLRQNWPPSVENVLKIVSAKDYLLPLTEFRLQKFKNVKKFTLSRDSLRIRLAKLIDISELEQIKSIIK